MVHKKKTSLSPPSKRMLRTQHFLSSNVFFPPIPTHHFIHLPISSFLNLYYRPLATPLRSFSAQSHRTNAEPWLHQVAEESPTTTTPPPSTQEEGPIELPSSDFSLFSTSDSPTPLQTATSILLTGSIGVFLFRSLRRRAKRAKELKFRSSGAKKSLKEEAIESFKAMSSKSVDVKGPPSPVQALLGAISAGVIAVILYKFTTTIEASLNRQTIPDNYSVRQITVTIRTIINGLCYLATFVFGINSVGLFLYSGQLAFNSFMGDTTKGGDEAQQDSSANIPVADSDNNNSADDPSSDKNQ